MENSALRIDAVLLGSTLLMIPNSEEKSKAFHLLHTAYMKAPESHKSRAALALAHCYQTGSGVGQVPLLYFSSST